MTSLIIFFGLLILINGSFGSGRFSYDGDHGPNHWGDEFNSCYGKHQSPINIEEHDVRNVSFLPLRFSGLDLPRSTSIVNNGHTVMLNVADSGNMLVSGGPLGIDQYAFEQLHFHWGANDHEGSEDLINNHSFAMELHAVFYKKSYGSMSLATAYSDGLAVLAYFFEVTEKDNPTFDTIISALPQLEGDGSMTKISKQLIFEPILIPNLPSMQNYFTYNGSLTTPPCLEIVTWIDFKEPLYLSHRQIELFRNLRDFNGSKLTHNFRPTQPLEGRYVFHNIPNYDSNNSGQSRIETPFVIALGAVLLTKSPAILAYFFCIFDKFI